jgi:hypothetical protein
MKLKRKGEVGSAMSLVLIFVTVSGMAIASLVFVTQVATDGVHQLSQVNKDSTAVAAATADILARFEKDQTLGTATYTGTTDNCGLGQDFALDPAIGVSFVSCVPVAGGAPTAVTTIGTTIPGGTVGVDYGTAFNGNFNSNNTIDTTGTFLVAPGSKVQALRAQENVPAAGGTSGTKSTKVISTTTDNTPLSPCALYSSGCRQHIKYWTRVHATPHLPTFVCSTTSMTITLSPGYYTSDDVGALNRITSPSDSSKYVGWVWQSGKYEDGPTCTNKGQPIEFKFKDGEYIFTGSATWKLNNSNVTLDNDPTNVVMCTTVFGSAGCENRNYKATNFAESKETDQYSCAEKSHIQSTLNSSSLYANSDSDYHGVRIFLDGDSLNVAKGKVLLCGSDFSDSQVLDNYVFISGDATISANCKSGETDTAYRCTNTPSSRAHVAFGSGAEVHLGGGAYLKNSDVSVSETFNKQHTWDRALIAGAMYATCTVSSGCEHNVRRSNPGQTAEFTFKTRDGKFFSQMININQYNQTSIITRIDN